MNSYNQKAIKNIFLKKWVKDFNWQFSKEDTQMAI